MKLTPASRALATIRVDVASSVGPPNIMVPRQIGEIFRPLRPRERYSMGWSFEYGTSLRAQRSNPWLLRKDGLLRRGAPRNDECYSPHSSFNILNTPLAVAIQRSPAVTSVVTKIRLRVVRITRGTENKISPIFPLSTKWTSS